MVATAEGREPGDARRRVVTGQRVAPAKVGLARVLRRAMTPEEALLWQWLRAGRLDGLHFRRQQIIGGFIVDFYCHAVGLVVEVDGPVHDAEQQKDYDAERDRILAAHGLRLLRFANEAVRDRVSDVIAQIAQAAKHAAPQDDDKLDLISPPSLQGGGISTRW